MKFFMVFIFTFFMCDSLGFAREKFQLSRGVISITVPKGWQVARDLFGIPLTLLGPKAADVRPVISYTPTDLHELRFDQKALEKNQEEYKTGREQWLLTKEGKSLQYYPYQFEHRKDGINFHRIGYAYEINNLRYSEYSYYILCGGQLFHSKVLFHEFHETNYRKVVDEVMGSFECK